MWSNEELQDEPIECRWNQSGLSVGAEREFWNQLVDVQTAKGLEEVTCCHVLSCDVMGCHVMSHADPVKAQFHI